jgi:hypothetical protein
MLGDAASMLIPKWHLVVFPGVAIVITVLSFSQLGGRDSASVKLGPGSPVRSDFGDAGRGNSTGKRSGYAAVMLPEVLVCPRCAGPRRILGAVTEPHAVRRLLAALGLAPPPGCRVTAS